jgi:RNA polymerase sigma-70 factor (ECF subfamily)
MRQAYDGLRPYLGFLLTVARSTAIDLMRAAGRITRESVPIEDLPELQQLASEALNPEQETLDDEVRMLVRRFLEGLSEEARVLARLRFMDGLSQEGAAERLGLTRGEMRVRERHLRTQFTEFLTASGWLDDAVEQRKLAVGVLLTVVALSVFGSVP